MVRSHVLALALDILEGRTSALLQAEKCISFSQIVNNHLGSVTLSTCESECLQAAKAVDENRNINDGMKILAGVPLSIKDNFCTKRIVTTAGSKMLESFVSPYDASIVQYLKKSDASICLKSNMDEFGMGSSMLNSAFGPCFNPWAMPHPSSSRVRLTAGGSSGASAVSVGKFHRCNIKHYKLNLNTQITQ